MADHQVTLNDAEEEALLYAVSLSSGGRPGDILKQWVDKGLADAAADLERRLKGLPTLPADRLARVKRAILGIPEPA